MALAEIAAVLAVGLPLSALIVWYELRRIRVLAEERALKADWDRRYREARHEQEDPWSIRRQNLN